MKVPSIPLAGTDGTQVNLSSLAGLTILFAYPRTGVPNQPNPPGWDAIPGARGCTPQACSFRDRFDEIKSLGVAHLYGLSVQSTDYQREMTEREHLPFSMLSDESLACACPPSKPTA
jgi:peroxiredoxin